MDKKQTVFQIIPIIISTTCACVLSIFLLGTWEAIAACTVFVAICAISISMTIKSFNEMAKLKKDAQRKASAAEIKAKKAEKEYFEKIDQSRAMVGRLNPHFVFNALATIAHLCKKDPQTAYKATIDFSDYFRHNLESLMSEPVIMFSKELDHIMKYTEIEKLRFNGRINLITDIGPDDFLIPALTILPFIDNAVRHGVLARKEGGTVSLSTWEEDYYYIVTIYDDGVGFDTSKIQDENGLQGIPNAKRRLESISGATVEINSVIDKETIVTIKIPK